MKIIKRTLLGLALLASALLIAGIYITSRHSALPVADEWALKGVAESPAGAVTVRFTGTSTLLFSDGETHWMVDGWFSRPAALALAFGKIAPDPNAITQGLQANKVKSLAAVIPVHSHYDHAMDAPEVARRTGAMLMGSESTANIGRGWDLDESQIKVLENRKPFQLGAFTVTAIESQHFQFPDPKTRERALGEPAIQQPLVPPVSVFDYRVGKAYVLHVSHPKGDFLVVGSAGYETGGLKDYKAHTVFLGIGGLGGQSPDYRETYWQETIVTVGASRVIPIHYDSLTGPIEGPFKGQSLVMSLLSGGEENTLPFLKSKEAAHPDLAFQTLPRYGQVVLFN